MTETSKIPSFFYALLAFVIVCVVGVYLTDVSNNSRQAQAYRNFGSNIPERGIPGGNSQPVVEGSNTAAAEAAGSPSVEAAAASEAAKSDPVVEAEALKRGSIYGRITTSEGFTVSGVNLEFTFSNSIEGGKKPPVYTATSGEAGDFQLSEMLAGSYNITSSHPHYKSSHAKIHVVREGLPLSSLELSMQSTIDMNLTVNDTRNNILSDAEVKLTYIRVRIQSETDFVSRSENLYREGKTNAKGAYTVKNVVLGRQILTVTSPGYVNYSQEIDVTGSIPPMPIVLEPASTLGGIVRTTTGVALDQATIKVNSEKNPKQTWEVKSTNGSFFFSQVPENHTFNLAASATGYLPTTLSNIPAGRNNLVVELEAGGTISGAVTNFSTGKKIEGIAIICQSVVESTESKTLRTTSLASGEYSFIELPAGQYNLYVQSETLTSEPRLGVTVKSGANTNNIDFLVYPGLRINGFVADSSTGERIMSANVSLESLVGPQFLEKRNSTKTTNELGLFSFNNIPYGLYTLSATADGYRKVPSGSSLVQVHLLPGEAVEPQEILLSRGGNINGLVLGRNNVPVFNATVQLFTAPGAVRNLGRNQLKAFDTTTDSSGAFVMEGIPLDDRLDLMVSADAAGYGKDKSEPIVLTEFLPTGYATVYLRAGGKLEVRVEGDDGFMLIDADVQFSSNEFPGDQSPERWKAKTNTVGIAQLSDLPNGSASVTASKTGYLSERRNIVVPADGRVDLVLSKSTTISGRVTDDANVPFSEGWVAAYAESGSFGGGRSNIDSNGFFKIEGIGSGTFTLEAEGARATQTGKHTARSLVRKIRAGETKVTISIPMRGRISGTIVDAQSLEPIPKATVRINGNYEAERTSNRRFGSSFATNQIPGEFNFTSIPPGEYIINYDAPGYLPFTSEPVKVGSPGWRDQGKVLLSKGAQVTGVVVDKKTGQSLNGVTVRISPSNKSTKTNSKGEYRISALEPNIYSLEFSHPEYINTKKDLVQISTNKVTDAGRTELSPGAAITIQVLDGKKNPVSRAAVSVRETVQEKSRTGNTNAGGRVTFQGLEPGGIFISVSKKYRDGTLTKTAERTISENDNLEIQVTLEGGYSLEGRILPPAGKSFVSPLLMMYPIELDGRPINRGNINVPLRNNEFNLTNLSQGNYLLCAQVTIDGIIARWHLAVRLSEPQTVVTLQPPSSSLSGKVLSQNTLFELAPMENAVVRLRALSFPHSGFSSLQSWWQWQTTASGTGAYRIPYLRAGEYELVVTPLGSEDPYVDIITIQQGNQKQYDVIINTSIKALYKSELSKPEFKGTNVFLPSYFEDEIGR